MESPSIFILPKRFDLWKIIFEGDLNFACRCPLCTSIISIVKGFWKIGQNQNDHLDVLWQTRQKDLEVWFRKDSALVSKVGIRLTWSNMTICHFGYFYFSFLFLFCSVCVNLSLAMFENLPNKINMVFDKICIGELCHIYASHFISFIFGFAF